MSSTDQLAQIRDTAVAILLAANTDAADRVERERIDATQPGDTPRLIIYADDDAQSEAPAGTAPRFHVTGTLIIQMLVEAARKDDAVSRLDNLVQQVKLGLFCQPSFTTLCDQIASYKVSRSFKDSSSLIVGDARMQITLTWRETYEPDLTTELTAINLTVAGTPANQSAVVGGASLTATIIIPT